MSEQVTIDKEAYEKLMNRVQELEERLEKVENEEKEEEESKKDENEWMGSMKEQTERAFKETTRFVKGMVDATVEAMNETAHAMGDINEETTRDSMNDVPGSIISMMRRAVDIQKKALDKFENSYKKED